MKGATRSDYRRLASYRSSTGNSSFSRLQLGQSTGTFPLYLSQHSGHLMFFIKVSRSCDMGSIQQVHSTQTVPVSSHVLHVAIATSFKELLYLEEFFSHRNTQILNALVEGTDNLVRPAGILCDFRVWNIGSNPSRLYHANPFLATPWLGLIL